MHSLTSLLYRRGGREPSGIKREESKIRYGPQKNLKYCPIALFNPRAEAYARRSPLILSLQYRRTRRSERNIEQLCLPSDDHPALPSELEVCSSDTGVDLADKLAGRVPDVNTVATARVDAARRVSMDTCEEVRGFLCEEQKSMSRGRTIGDE